MSKIFKSILAFILAVSVLLGISSCLYDSEDTPGLSTDTESNDNTETTENSQAPADTSSPNPDAALQLGDENLYIVYVTNNDGRAKIGFVANGLKPYTKYRMDWNINDSVFVDTVARFSTATADGTVRNCIYLNTSYEPNEGLGLVLFSDIPSVLLNGNGGDGWEFTTEGDDATLVVFFFESDYVNAEQMKALTDAVKSYVTELSFTEIAE